MDHILDLRGIGIASRLMSDFALRCMICSRALFAPFIESQSLASFHQRDFGERSRSGLTLVEYLVSSLMRLAALSPDHVHRMLDLTITLGRIVSQNGLGANFLSSSKETSAASSLTLSVDPMSRLLPSGQGCVITTSLIFVPVHTNPSDGLTTNRLFLHETTRKARSFEPEFLRTMCCFCASEAYESQVMDTGLTMRLALDDRGSAAALDLSFPIRGVSVPRADPGLAGDIVGGTVTHWKGMITSSHSYRLPSSLQNATLSISSLGLLKCVHITRRRCS
mmetsp:Transcript_15006/g.30383  ORF Transcript_15006/g.30383 Transcript_15006/m.30383 type:complete len:279 (-) Transcript_15006:1159-1995(-)